MRTLWQVLEREITRRGASVVAADIQLIADRFTDDVTDIIGQRLEVSADHDLRPGTCSRASLVIRIMKELLNAQASTRRAANIVC